MSRGERRLVADADRNHAKESALITTEQADLTAALREAIRSSDPRLSKFAPLPRILAFDEFDRGAHGWVELRGNYNGRGDLGTVDDHMRDFRPPQLSTRTSSTSVPTVPSPARTR